MAWAMLAHLLQAHCRRQCKRSPYILWGLRQEHLQVFFLVAFLHEHLGTTSGLSRCLERAGTKSRSEGKASERPLCSSFMDVCTHHVSWETLKETMNLIAVGLSKNQQLQFCVSLYVHFSPGTAWQWHMIMKNRRGGEIHPWILKVCALCPAPGYQHPAIHAQDTSGTPEQEKLMPSSSWGFRRRFLFWFCFVSSLLIWQ